MLRRMGHGRPVSLAIGLLLLAAQLPAQRAVPRVWATHDGTRVMRDGPAHPDRDGNAVWNGHEIRLLAARNEIVAFQVIVEANDAISALSAALPLFTHASGEPVLRYAAPAPDPTQYVDRPIQLFSQHYLDVRQRTRASWVFAPDGPAAPTTPLGWTPVQLVPENARAGRGGFPLQVRAGERQGIWIEVSVGPDLSAGEYRGVVTVDADGQRTRLPVMLEVLDVTLPDATLPAMVYYERSQTDLYHGRNMDPAYHRFARRHRVEFTHAYDEASAREAAARFDGRAFTRAEAYTGPGEGRGYQIIPRTFYGPGRDFDTPEGARDAVERWSAFIRGLAPRALTFVYLPDEPRPAQFPRVNAVGRSVRDAARNLGSPVKTLVTHGYSAEIADAVDIWAAVPAHYDATRARTERAAGKQSWFYNGGRPQMGAIVIDAPATDSRVVGWAAFRHDVDGYFYWHANHWRHNGQKKLGDRNQDVWREPITFDNRSEGKMDNGFINGDGVLVYPGEDVLHPDEDRGIAGPVSSIQMANLRRGLQDHALLTLARQRGAQGAVAEALDATVPRVLSDAGRTIGFAEDGNVWERARQRLLRAVVAVRPAGR